MARLPFYASPGWLKARGAALIRDNYLCVRCLAAGRFRAANTVHHVVHFRDRPDLALVLDNLESLCAACHNEAHPEKSARKMQDAQRPGVVIYKL